VLFASKRPDIPLILVKSRIIFAFLLKKVAKKFAVSEKSRTFASAFAHFSGAGHIREIFERLT